MHTMIQILVFLLLLLTDRVSKHFASAWLRDQADRTVLEGILDLHYLENTGAAFGLLHNLPWLFYVIGGIAVILMAVAFCLIFFRLRKGIRKDVLSGKTVSDHILLNYLLSVLAAGAVGNLIDRAFYGYVIDFLNFTFISFPVFNAADIFVTVSVVLLFVFLVFVYKQDSYFQLFGKDKRQKNAE